MLMVSSLHLISAGHDSAGPQAIDVAPEWSSLVLFARIVRAFHNHPLPNPLSVAKFPAELRHHFSSPGSYREVGDWVRKQADDKTNDKTVRETCQILSRYFEPVRLFFSALVTHTH